MTKRPTDDQLLDLAASLSARGRELWVRVTANASERNEVWLELLNRGHSKNSIALHCKVGYNEVNRVALKAKADGR